MNRRYPMILLLLLCANAACAQEVSVWLTEIPSGDQKDASFGSWDDDRRYDIHQDDEFSLFRRVESVELREQSAGHAWQVRLDPTKSRQEILGLGAAMTDASAYVLYQLKKENAPLYEFTMERLFSPEHGAGFSYLRRPIGSSDYTATETNYSYADEPSEDLSTFSIDHDKLYIIPMLKEVLRINPDVQILGSPWSAPAWMKTNGRLNGVTSEEKAAGTANRLQPEYFDLYAEYFVRFLKAYADEGITIHAITLQNEPQFDTAAYPCMRMTAEDQIELVKCLGPKLEAEQLKTKILIHDHNWQLHPNDRVAVGGDVKQDPVELVTQILSDPTAGSYVSGSAWHCYSGGEAEMKQAYATIRQRFPDKAIYCTELSGWGRNRGPWFGDVRWGLAHNWLGSLAAGASVSLEWNLALDHKFGPTLREDSAAMGLVTVNTDTWQEVKFEREFYAMAQVSRAARPGSRPIETRILKQQQEMPNAQFSALGFVGQDGSRSMFLANNWNTPGTVDVVCDGKFFEYTLPPKSLATCVWAVD